MMASDIPARHRDSTSMARALASYMVDAKAIRREVLSQFNSAPSVWTIDRMRAEYLRSKERPKAEPFKPHDGYSPTEASRRAEAASVRLLEALKAERAKSAEFVNPKWSRAA